MIKYILKIFYPIIIIEIEKLLNSARKEMTHVAYKISSSKDPKIYEHALEAAKEQYLNIVDLFCYFAHKNYLPEDYTESHYQFLKNCIKSFSKELEENTNYFKNILIFKNKLGIK